MKAVVFDLDGTLVDTLRDLAEATNRALEANGFPACPLEAYTQMVGNGARKLIERGLGGACTPERTERVLADFIRIYDRGCLMYTRPYAGMEETVDALQQKGLCLLVVTNKPEKQACKIVSHFFPSRFSAVYGGLAGRPAKPDPAVTLSALKTVGIEQGEALFVGDSNVDIYTARAAGVRSAGAAWGFRGEKELRAAGADYLLPRPEALLDLLE